MRSVSYKCDICGKTKGEGNKWLLAYREEEGVKRITLFAWDGVPGRCPDHITRGITGIEHLCSEACAFSLASRVLRVGW